MEVNKKEVFEILDKRKIFLPVLVGMLVIIYLFVTDPDVKLSHLRLVSDASLPYVLLSTLFIFFRDWGYMYRLRVITHHQLSWLSCFYVTLLWEFSSAVTPSVVGGSVVAIYLIYKEGIPLAKSLAYVMITAIFDNLFFIFFAPIGFLNVHSYLDVNPSWGKGVEYFFWIGYGITLFYTVLSAFALFVKPFFFKWLLVKVTSFRFLRRWQAGAIKQGDDMITASSVLQGEKPMYWLQIMVITMFVWSARYAVMNALIAAYVPINWAEHVMIFGKQVIIWVVMLLSPTPGSSGTAEYFFRQFYGSLLGNYVLVTTVLWRLITYYFYLIAGILALPRWLRRVMVTPDKAVKIDES